MRDLFRLWNFQRVRLMRVAVLCEFSGIVRDAFIRRGHDAVSCDLLPDENGSGPHLQGDCLSMDWSGFDLAICHPPCTYLTRSGAMFIDRLWRRDSRREAIEFVWQLMSLSVPRIAVENPVGVLSSTIRKPDQVIQPWQFGFACTKATCLWLKNLPLLRPTYIVTPHPKNELQFAQPHAERWRLRSRTVYGIAEAMADQWGRL